MWFLISLLGVDMQFQLVKGKKENNQKKPTSLKKKNQHHIRTMSESNSFSFKLFTLVKVKAFSIYSQTCPKMFKITSALDPLDFWAGTGPTKNIFVLWKFPFAWLKWAAFYLLWEYHFNHCNEKGTSNYDNAVWPNTKSWIWQKMK